MNSVQRQRITTARAFTLVEILVVIVIVTLLGGISAAVYSKAVARGKTTRSISNLRQLATANIAYAADNLGEFCPAQDRRNRKRWHGERSSSGDKFDPTRGFLAPYLGEDGRVKTCPLFSDIVTDQTFELGTGGYGYNATYIGGRPGNPFQPALLAHIPSPSQTVMFATTALARSQGTQEYPYTEPYQWVDDQGNPVGDLQPSTHFRANGKALVAWCDGHVTAERPNNDESGANYYGGDNEDHHLGWFGPKEQNGYWNPKADPKIFRP
jgi:prepilin-type N-terminal cleavage/methylation domain-containing protein/prepilin-type processing-associated H-X9-DG protein